MQSEKRKIIPIYIALVFSFSLLAFSLTPATRAAACPDPLCITNVQINKTHNSATITWTTDKPATSQVEFWQNVRSTTKVPTTPSAELKTSHSINISNLKEFQVYYYRIYSNISNFNATHNGQFTTNRPPTNDTVVISNESVGSITQSSARVTWKTNVSATSQVEYWENPRFTTKVPPTAGSTLRTAHSVDLTGLKPSTKYFYRAVSTKSGFTAQGTAGEFTTKSGPCTDPVCISNETVENIQTGSATITWKTSVPANSQVLYGPSPRLDLSSALNSNLTTNHTIILTNLKVGEQYYYMVVSTARVNNEDYTARAGGGPFTTGRVGDGDGSGGGSGSGSGSGDQPPRQFTFEIENPLRGGPNNIFEIINIITRWILQLSIPIAVLAILWAGFLYLTAGANVNNVKKARDVLWYTVIGLAIIFVGRGFITLIYSVIELGGTDSSENGGNGNEPPETGFCQDNGRCSNNSSQTCDDDGDCNPGKAPGGSCTATSDCKTGLICNNSMCTFPTGNTSGYPCKDQLQCANGLFCDPSQPVEVEDEIVGTCQQPTENNPLPPKLQIGDFCQRDSQCDAGLECNEICQRKNGNEFGEFCVSDANPSNCKSRACLTSQGSSYGTCTDI